MVSDTLSLIKKIFEEKPFLSQNILKGTMSYHELADIISHSHDIDKKEIVKALESYSLELERGFKPVFFEKGSEVKLTSNLFEITLPSTSKHLVQAICDQMYHKDLFLMTLGPQEISLIIEKKHSELIEGLLEKHMITPLAKTDGLAAVTLKLSHNAYNLLGLFYLISRALNWASVPIVEIFSTYTELTFVVYEKDSLNAMKVMKDLINSG